MNDRRNQLQHEKRRWQQRRAQQLNEREEVQAPTNQTGRRGTLGRLLGGELGGGEKDSNPGPTGSMTVDGKSDISVGLQGSNELTSGQEHTFSMTNRGQENNYRVTAVAGPIPFLRDSQLKAHLVRHEGAGGEFSLIDWFLDEHVKKSGMSVVQYAEQSLNEKFNQAKNSELPGGQQNIANNSYKPNGDFI